MGEDQIMALDNEGADRLQPEEGRKDHFLSVCPVTKMKTRVSIGAHAVLEK